MLFRLVCGTGQFENTSVSKRPRRWSKRLIRCDWCQGDFPVDQFESGEYHQSGRAPVPHSRFGLSVPNARPQGAAPRSVAFWWVGAIWALIVATPILVFLFFLIFRPGLIGSIVTVVGILAVIAAIISGLVRARHR